MQQRAVRSAAPPPAAPSGDSGEQHAIQFSTRPTSTRKALPRPHVVGVGMTIKTSSHPNPKLPHKIVITAIAKGGGACQSGQIEVGDMILGIASTPDARMVHPETLDQAHDLLQGAAGTNVLLQIEKKTFPGRTFTVECSRIEVQNSDNMALHDHSTEFVQGKGTVPQGMVPDTYGLATTYVSPRSSTNDQDRVLAGIYGGKDSAQQHACDYVCMITQ